MKYTYNMDWRCEREREGGTLDCNSSTGVYPLIGVEFL